jgi:2-polyprenyl-3-methyl-5-hydroxy-6-metoxy-1,4-benzoquinol methylase
MKRSFTTNHKIIGCEHYESIYITPNIYGPAYQVLIDYFVNHVRKGRVVDIGCGQGRNAIPLARLGYQVVGVDASWVGVKQMLSVTNKEKLSVVGIAGDFSTFTDFHDNDTILLDGIIGFGEKDSDNEFAFLRTLFQKLCSNTLVVFVLPNSTLVEERLINLLSEYNHFIHLEKKFEHRFESEYYGVSDTINLDLFSTVINLNV